MAGTSAPFMVDEAEGCSRDGESESADELDDEMMEQIANGLPLSVDTCIALNQVYQELMQAFMRHVEACLAQNREKQRTLEQELRSYSGEGGAKKRDSKVPVLMYIPPYFRDSAGLAPRKNDDAIRKASELDILVEPSKRWTEGEKKKLYAAVENAIIQQELSPLSNKRHFLAEEMKAETNSDTLTSLTKQIHDLDKKMDAMKNQKGVASSASTKTFENIDWTHISVAEFQGSRTAHECRQLFLLELNPNLNQNPTWSKDELRKLEEIAEQHEFRDWKTIALELNTGRTAFQCFEKYQSELNRRITRRKWTLEEDAKLREAVRRQGDFIQWDQVADMVEGRTRNQCFIRWQRTLSPGIKRGPWTEEEDLLLLAAVEKYGPKDWAKIAEFIPGRTDNQCRERWASTLTTGQRTGFWTHEEDALLMEGIKQFGVGAWSKICQFLPGRTSVSCKVRHLTIRKQKETTGDIRVMSYNVKRGMNIRMRKMQEKRRRIEAMYTRIAGHPPLLKRPTGDAENLLSGLPEDLRAMFREKLAAVQMRLEAECPTGRSRAIWRARLNRARAGRDIFQAILTEEEEMPMRVLKSVRPTKELAEIMKTSRALLPPTGCTLRGLRNLLSWHGADLLVAPQLGCVSVGTTTDSNAAVASSSAVLTSESSTHFDEQGSQCASSDLNSSLNDSAILDEPIPYDMIPNDESSIYSFLALRDTFRQFFLWPSLLATMDDPNP